MKTHNIKISQTTGSRLLIKACYTWYFLILFLIALTPSCRKFVTIDAPRTQIIRTAVFSDDATATSAVTGIYSQMFASSVFTGGGQNGLTMLAGLSADELKLNSTSPDLVAFATNSLTPTTGLVTNAIWKPSYQYIYYANAVLEGLAASQSLTLSVKNQLTGECKFIRAFCYYYLVNLFDGVPLVTSTDYLTNKTLGRATRQEIFNQIISDLKDAKTVLPANYSFASAERVRPNKWAATALLARTYLFNQQWAEAEAEASQVIGAGLYSLSSLNGVFLANSSEAIWQLKPSIPGYNTLEGQTFIFTTSPGLVSLTPSQLNSFSSSDQRKSAWIGSTTIAGVTYYYPKKYKINATGLPVTEYSMILRLGEQYLIRAEARTMLNNIAGAQADLNMIRTRAGLSNGTATDQATLLDAVLIERQNELFAEWGHRWLDLKRRDIAGAILSSKGSSWQDTDTLYPIPQTERLTDPNITQNPGY